MLILSQCINQIVEIDSPEKCSMTALKVSQWKIAQVESLYKTFDVRMRFFTKKNANFEI